eukprot:SM000005S17147  [mRNA]  locus=s5:408611:419235:+ [translate_table: standard]
MTADRPGEESLELLQIRGANMATLAVGLILEKIASKDKDFRYMATSDLLNELQRDTFKADPETERKVSQIVLQQLEDASGDISGLTPLVKKVSEARVVDLVENLSTKLLTGKEQQRDIASIALKVVVAELPGGQVANSVLQSFTPKLIKGIAAPETSTEVKSDCLDLLADVLQRFGWMMMEQHKQMLDALLVQLDSPRAGLRKRAIQCLASLSSSMSDALLLGVTRAIVQQMVKAKSKVDIVRSYIQMIGALCRAVGYRFGPHLAELVPLLTSYCKEASESDDELRENSLQALESFVLRCPKDVAEHCPLILELALEYLSYDPNFTDDMDEDHDEDLEDEDEAEESAEEYSDDEDVSWKVRRAATKCLSALIVSRQEMIATFYSKASPKIIERFREREENVKIDVFNAYADLLRQTGLVTKGTAEPYPLSSSPLDMLRQEVPKLVRALNKQLREKSIKTRIGTFGVLRQLVLVLPNSMADYIASLIPGIEKALQDKASTSNLKIEALIFTRLVVSSHSPPLFNQHVKVLSSAVLAAMSERYYKVTAEALRVCGELVKAIRPSFSDPPEFDFKPYVQPLYSATMKRLTAQDQDQEVKECTITCMCLIISILGDNLKRELKTCLPLLLDRLRNEITRQTVVKAFSTIAESPLGVDLSPVLEQVLSELTSFLRKANRALRQASLVTINALLASYSKQASAASYAAIIEELCPLISDVDLHMTALVLELCCTMIADSEKHADCGSLICEKVLPQVLVVLKSSLLQGQALQMLQQFLASLVRTANISFDALLDELLLTSKGASALGGGVSKQAYHSIAQCVAVLCVAAGDVKCDSTVEMLLNNLRSGSGRDAMHLLSLLCLGEIGRRKDLSGHADIETVITSSFQSPSEEIKAAASYSLGNVAVGNLAKYLPFILHQIDNHIKLQYLLLHSLKEVISRQSHEEELKVTKILEEKEMDTVLQLLFAHCESEEEGVRNVVAECLGKLALIEAATLIPLLKERTRSPSPFTRATVVTSIKFTVVGPPAVVEAHMKPCIRTFLQLIEDEDRHVRRAAVLTLSTAAHNRPSLVVDLLPELLPLLYDQTIVKEELIRTVDLGPFKHTVDDGLELRKAAFECVDTLLDTCLDSLDPSSFIIPYLVGGLSVVDTLVEPLEKTVTEKTKPDAVKQEVDRNEDMIRSALRAIDSLSRIPNVELSGRFKAFMHSVLKVGVLAAKFEAVRHEGDSLLQGRGQMANEYAPGAPQESCCESCEQAPGRPPHGCCPDCQPPMQNAYRQHTRLSQVLQGDPRGLVTAPIAAQRSVRAALVLLGSGSSSSSCSSLFLLVLINLLHNFVALFVAPPLPPSAPNLHLLLSLVILVIVVILLPLVVLLLLITQSCWALSIRSFTVAVLVVSSTANVIRAHLQLPGCGCRRCIRFYPPQLLIEHLYICASHQAQHLQRTCPAPKYEYPLNVQNTTSKDKGSSPHEWLRVEEALPATRSWLTGV